MEILSQSRICEKKHDFEAPRGTKRNPRTRRKKSKEILRGKTRFSRVSNAEARRRDSNVKMNCRADLSYFSSTEICCKKFDYGNLRAAEWNLHGFPGKSLCRFCVLCG
jgi:hypothetical protein